MRCEKESRSPLGSIQVVARDLLDRLDDASPPNEGPGNAVLVRLQDKPLKRLYDFRRQELDLPSRAEAIRGLVERGGQREFDLEVRLEQASVALHHVESVVVHEKDGPLRNRLSPPLQFRHLGSLAYIILIFPCISTAWALCSRISHGSSL
jgi:hypothetical protein